MLEIWDAVILIDTTELINITFSYQLESLFSGIRFLVFGIMLTEEPSGFCEHSQLSFSLLFFKFRWIIPGFISLFSA